MVYLILIILVVLIIIGLFFAFNKLSIENIFKLLLVLISSIVIYLVIHNKTNLFKSSTTPTTSHKHEKWGSIGIEKLCKTNDNVD